MTLASRILLVAAVALLLVGVGVAITQPGSLGDDEAAPTTSSSETTETTEPTGTTSTSSTTAGTSTSTSEPGAGTSTSAPTSTTAPGGDGGTGDGGAGDGGTGDGDTGGSGFGDDGAAQPSDTADGLADTGGESLILAGVLCAAAGLAIRRRA